MDEASLARLRLAPGTAEAEPEQPQPAAEQLQAAVQLELDRAARTRHSIILRWIGLGLAGLPLGTLAALLVNASLYHPPPTSTGDPLLDALYSDFDRPGSTPWGSGELESVDVPDLGFYNSDYLRDDTLVGNTLLSQLDQRFTGDPRYWLLLYQNAQFSPPDSALQDLKRRELPERTWFLEEARRHGAVNVDILVRLLACYDDPWKHQAGAFAQQTPNPQARQAPRWDVEKWAKVEPVFKQASNDQLEPLLAELLQLGHEDAAAHYVAAKYRAACGDYAAAQRLLAQGNRLGVESNYQLLTGGLLWQTDQPPPPRLWAVEDMALGAYYARPLPNYIEWKEMVRKLAYDAARRDDRGALQNLHVFGCRFGQAGGRPVIGQMVGMTFAGLAQSALEDFGSGGLSKAELAGLSQMRQRRAKLKDELKNLSKASNSFSTSLLGPGNLTGRLALEAQDTFANGAASSSYYMELGRRSQLYEQGYYEQVLKPLWEGLERCDYRNLGALAPAVSSVPGGIGGAGADGADGDESADTQVQPVPLQ